MRSAFLNSIVEFSRIRWSSRLRYDIDRRRRRTDVRRLIATSVVVRMENGDYDYPEARPGPPGVRPMVDPEALGEVDPTR